MSVITDEMDRLKAVALKKYKNINQKRSEYEILAFHLGYAYGMEDARHIQETIKRLAKEAVKNAGE